MRESRRPRRIRKTKDNRKWISILGFVFSVGLLSIAIVLSVNQERIDKLASTNEYFLSNTTMSVGSEINKSINEVVDSNKIEGEPVFVKKTNNSEENKTENHEQSSEIEKQNEAKYVFEVKTDNQDHQESSNNESIIESDKENNPKEQEDNKQFTMPVNGEIYKEYAMDSLIYSDTLQEWVTHRGVDFQVNLSDDVKASASGTVKSIKNDPRYGWSIIIEHKDGFSTIYTCLVDTSLVKEGDSVEQGQTIAKAGNSGVFEFADGSHLHFEMMKDGKYINPEMYLK